MRKAAALCFLLLCSAAAFGQEPQWTVVQHVVVAQQNSLIPFTTLLTPTEPNAYRITVYFSGGDEKGTGSFTLLVNGFDITGLPLGIQTNVNCSIKTFASMPPLTTILRPESTLGFEVLPFKNNAASCQYNLVITVEQLVQQ